MPHGTDASPSPTVDPEALYQLIYDERWPPLLRHLHRHRDQLDADPLLRHAAQTFEDAFFQHLDGQTPDALKDELETLFLLHTGAFYALPRDRFETVIEALVALHADRPEVAAGYARHCPENPRCAEVLAAHPSPESEAPPLRSNAPVDGADATISLFRSGQEEAFFRAAREVFATYFVYPNVALHCLVDYERLQPHLSATERAYFFRAAVDCVVFDQHDAYRPRYFFELDSALHDAPERQERDRHKDRILALAGQRLYRIRTPEADAHQFARMLREIVEGQSD
ncbi:MAG: DUF2726 domain-containing protein [Bacteroidetes bacterium]|jgi:hypothetical protein|nr:DUF2726 domain-containing protein [Bacteroidota bacterium]